MLNVPDYIVEYFQNQTAPLYWLVPKTLSESSEICKGLRHFQQHIENIINSGVYNGTILNDIKHLPPDERSLAIMIHEIQESIAIKRIELLLLDLPPNRSSPYDHPSLCGIEVDPNGLVRMNDFTAAVEGFTCGLKRGNHVFEILPSISSSTNSMYWANGYLHKLMNNNEIRVRLDPLMILSAEDYKPLMYKMWVYGKSFDWSDIENLKEDQHARFMPDFGFQSDVKFTDLVWSPRHDEIHFICEEVPKTYFQPVRGSRYCHSIYLPHKQSVIHCDGAIRLFSQQELVKRYDSHVRNIGKIGKRKKVFQVDGVITTTEWTSLVSSFFVWNTDIERYFEKHSEGN